MKNLAFNPGFTLFLLTERKGRTERVLLEVFLVRTEGSEVRTHKTEGEILPVLTT